MNKNEVYPRGEWTGVDVVEPHRPPENPGVLIYVSPRHPGDSVLRPWSSDFTPVRPTTAVTLPVHRRSLFGFPVGRHGCVGNSLETGHPARLSVQGAPITLPSRVDWIHLILIILLAVATACQAACFAFGVW